MSPSRIDEPTGTGPVSGNDPNNLILNRYINNSYLSDEDRINLWGFQYNW
jgi:hypothetical protein